jgi:hypothetical protein
MNVSVCLPSEKLVGEEMRVVCEGLHREEDPGSSPYGFLLRWEVLVLGALDDRSAAILA